MDLPTKILNEVEKMPIGLQEELLNYAQYLSSKLNKENNLDVLRESESEIIKKWEYLLEHDQELDPENPLSDSELEVIRQILIRQNKPRPDVPKTEEIFIADDFNAPLPDDILDSFYS
jgi:hypothetical protein